MDFLQSEYGSARASGRKDFGTSNRQTLMYAICGAALVLSIIALAQGQDTNPSYLAEVAERAVAKEAHTANVEPAAVHSKEVEARVQSKSIHPLAAASAAVHSVSQPLKAYVAAKQVKLAKQAATKIVAEHAAVPTHTLVKVPAAAIKPVHAAHEAAPHVPQVIAKPAAHEEAEEAHKAQIRAKQAEVRAHIAKGGMLDDEAPPAEAAAPAAGDAAPAEPTEIFHSPVGDLKPTGIMSVFFNENIMITAVCVIAFLLLAICCFARNADCALT